MVTRTDGGNTLLGYYLDINPDKIDGVFVRFEGERGDIISVYRRSEGGPEKLIAQYNHAFPSAHFDDVGGIEGISQSNRDWTERQILQHVISKICGVDYCPNEDGFSFDKRLDYEQRWKRQQC